MIEPLPVSKKLLHAYLVLPVLCVTLLSYGIGIIAGKGAAPRENLLFYGEKRYDRSLDVRVPLEYWEIGWSGEPAPVETEHDEKPYAAWSTPLFAGADIVLYSPYHTPPGSSPRFVSEQLSKAAERIFGTRLDPAEIESRYFSGNADGESPISGATINIGRDFPELPVRSWQRILPVIVILIGAIWFGITPLTFYMYSSGRNGRILQLVLGAVVTIWILLVIFVTSSGITFGWKVSAFSWILVRKLAGAVPAGTGLLWIVAAAVMFFGCRLSGARFRSIEAPIRRSGAYHR